MDMGFEVTVYVIALIITAGLGFITHSIIEINRRLKRQILEQQQRLMTFILQHGESQENDELHGNIDLTHPKTGEKLTARARFKILRSPRPR
jgi:Na+-translocating ferredoxin:NAD+ oxidoreductase RnfG subunit